MLVPAINIYDSVPLVQLSTSQLLRHWNNTQVLRLQIWPILTPVNKSKMNPAELPTLNFSYDRIAI